MSAALCVGSDTIPEALPAVTGVTRPQRGQLFRPAGPPLFLLLLSILI